MQHLGHSHKDHGLCSVNKVDHRGSNGNRLPCSVYASTVGWGHSSPEILGFYWQHKLQPLHCRCWRSESTSSVPCVQATMQLRHGKHCSSPLHLETGDPLYSPSNGTSPLKSSTFQVVAPFGAGIQHQRRWWMMQSPSPLLWLAALGRGVSHHWRLHRQRHQFMEKLLVVLHAGGYNSEGPVAVGDLCWGRETQETMGLDNPCQHCGHGWMMTERGQ